MKYDFDVSLEVRRAEIKAENERRVSEKISECLRAKNSFASLVSEPFVCRSSIDAEGKKHDSLAVVYPSRLIKALVDIDIFSAIRAENAFGALYLVTVDYLKAVCGIASLSVPFGAVKAAFYKWLEALGMKDRCISPSVVRVALHSIMKLAKGKEGKKFDVLCITASAVEKVFFKAVCGEAFDITSKDLKATATEKAAKKAAAAAAADVEARQNFLTLAREKSDEADKAAAAAESKLENDTATEEEKAAAAAAKEKASKMYDLFSSAYDMKCEAAEEAAAAAAAVKATASILAEEARKTAAAETTAK